MRLLPLRQQVQLLSKLEQGSLSKVRRYIPEKIRRACRERLPPIPVPAPALPLGRAVPCLRARQGLPSPLAALVEQDGKPTLVDNPKWKKG